MNLEEIDGFDDHEMVVFCNDARSGLRAIIAVHDTTLGPAMGGCRMHPYDSLEAATRDVLRLSAGMTAKNAISRIPYGGAKAVIVGNPAIEKTDNKLLALAEMINRLNGTYITAEDAGITGRDIALIGGATPFTRLSCGYTLEDPSIPTAQGLLSAIRTAVNFVGLDSLEDQTVAVEGLGKVGMRLCELLFNEGARLVVTDLDPDKVSEAGRRFEARSAAPGELHRASALVYAPCALGAVLNARTIPEIGARIVAGAANNQLESPDDGELMHQRGILYCPDFVVNSGGVLGTFGWRKVDSTQAALACAEEAGQLLKGVLDLAFERGISTQRAATQRVLDCIGRKVGNKPRAATGLAMQ